MPCGAAVTAAVAAVLGSQVDGLRSPPHLPTTISRTYHAGHQAEHVIRLHRVEGHDRAVMREAEDRWQRMGSGHEEFTAGPSSFVTLSTKQVQALRQHHQHREQVRLHSQQEAPRMESFSTATQLHRSASQYVGPIGVGEKRKGKKCDASADVSSLPYVPRDDENRTNATCFTEEVENIRVVFDTGSANLWIASDLCQEGACTKKDRRRFDHTESMTFTYANTNAVSIQFGTGHVEGPQGADAIHFGNFTVRNQTFGMIQEEDGSVFEKVLFEGILGMAFPAMSANGATPIVDNLIRQKVLSHNEFAFYLSPTEPAANLILWGGVDTQFFEGKIEKFPVTEAWYWSIALKSLKVGEHEVLPVEDGKTWSAIADTGTTFNTASGAVFDKLFELLPGTKCGDVNSTKYPDIAYTFENAAGEERLFRLTAEEYMIKDGGDNHCSLAFMEIAVPEEHGPAVLLGGIFFQAYFTVFDRADGDPKNAMVGFARAKHGQEVHEHVHRITKSQGPI